MYTHQYEQWEAERHQRGTEEMIRMRQPVAPPQPVTVEVADGFLVISRTRQPKSVIPPYRHDYHYDHFDHENDATEMYGEIERGEYGNARQPVRIVPCRGGVPLGAKKVL